METKDKKSKLEQKKALIIVGTLATISLVLDVLISIIVYYFAIGEFNKALNEEESYIVSKEVIDINDNLLQYLEENNEKASIANKPEKVFALSFESGHLNIAAEAKDNILYYDITTSYTGIEETLTSFKDEKPAVDSYLIDISIEIKDDTKFNPNGNQKRVGHASYIDGLDKRYISFTSVFDENNYVTCFHEEYKDGGSYDTKKVNNSSYPLFYNYCYFIVNF